MSTNPFSDPYANPQQMPGQFYSGPPMPPRKPGALTAVGVVALVMGILGLGGACLVIAFVPFQAQVQAIFSPPPGPNAPPAQRLQFEMQTEMAAVHDRYFETNMVFGVLHLILATLMIVGGTLVLRLRPNGRPLLMYTLLAVILFEVARAGVGLVVQLEAMPITTEYMERIMRQSGPGAEFFVRMMKGLAIFGLVFSLMWPLAKIIIYGISARYLASEPIVALFGGGSKSGAST